MTDRLLVPHFDAGQRTACGRRPMTYQLRVYS